MVIMPYSLIQPITKSLFLALVLSYSKTEAKYFELLHFQPLPVVLENVFVQISFIL